MGRLFLYNRLLISPERENSQFYLSCPDKDCGTVARIVSSYTLLEIIEILNLIEPRDEIWNCKELYRGMDTFLETIATGKLNNELNNLVRVSLRTIRVSINSRRIIECEPVWLRE